MLSSTETACICPVTMSSTYELAKAGLPAFTHSIASQPANIELKTLASANPDIIFPPHNLHCSALTPVSGAATFGQVRSFVPFVSFVANIRPGVITKSTKITKVAVQKWHGHPAHGPTGPAEGGMPPRSRLPEGSATNLRTSDSLPACAESLTGWLGQGRRLFHISPTGKGSHSAGPSTMVGVMKTSSSRLIFVLDVCLNRYPKTGISLSSGMPPMFATS